MTPVPQPSGMKVESHSPFAQYIAYEGSHVDDPRQVSVEIVSEGLCRIVEIEGPLLVKRAYDIYLRGCGIKRLAHDLRNTMNRALQVAVRRERVITEAESGTDDLLFAVARMKGSPPIKLRSRGPRTFEEIPPSELQTVARYLSEPHGLEAGSDDHLRAILDRFDLKRLTIQVAKSLQETLGRQYPHVDEHLIQMQD